MFKFGKIPTLAVKLPVAVVRSLARLPNSQEDTGQWTRCGKYWRVPLASLLALHRTMRAA